MAVFSINLCVAGATSVKLLQFFFPTKRDFTQQPRQNKIYFSPFSPPTYMHVTYSYRILMISYSS